MADHGPTAVGRLAAIIRIRRREALRSRNPRSAVSLDNIRSGEDGGAPGLRDIYGSPKSWAPP